ncbi:MAG: hypothetical protein AAF844_15890 [Pseudomonadota bacterium]
MDGIGLELVADGLLIVTALAAAIYCAVLSRRLRRLSSTEDGIGGQITALNTAVEETRTALATAQERIDALKSQSGQSSERVRREMAQARKLSEELAEAATEARALLDKIYTAELPAPPSQSPPDEAGQTGDAGVAAVATDAEGEDFAVVGAEADPLAKWAEAEREGRAAAGTAQADEASMDAAFDEAEAGSYSFGSDAGLEGPDKPKAAAHASAERADDSVAQQVAAGGGRALRLQRMAF